MSAAVFSHQRPSLQLFTGSGQYWAISRRTTFPVIDRDTVALGAIFSSSAVLPMSVGASPHSGSPRPVESHTVTPIKRRDWVLRLVNGSTSCSILLPVALSRTSNVAVQLPAG